MAGDVDGDPEPLDKKCKICSEIINRGGLKCTTVKCNVFLHSKCFDLVAKVLYIEKKSWKCKMCTENLKGQYLSSNIDAKLLEKENECLVREADMLNKRIHDLEYIVSLQKSKLDSVENIKAEEIITNDKAVSNSSYSQQLKKSVNKPSAVLFIKSGDNSISNTKIEQDVKSAINPGSLNININNTKLIKNGIVISCEDKNSLEKLKDSLESKVGNRYMINEPVKRNPRISVHNIKTEDFEPTAFINTIIHDNNLLAEMEDIKFIVKLKYKSVYNVVLAVVPKIFKSILARGYLYVGWEKHSVREHLNLPRCFKCCQFGHIKKDCRSPHTICRKCSGTHDMSHGL